MKNYFFLVLILIFGNNSALSQDHPSTPAVESQATLDYAVDPHEPPLGAKGGGHYKFPPIPTINPLDTPTTPVDTPTQTIPDRFNYCEVANKIYAAYDSGDLAYIKKMAVENNKDSFVFPACQLLRYSAKNISAKEFIEAFPANKNDFDFFCGRPRGCETPCKIFGDSQVGHPLFPYYEELFKLMAKGDRRAVIKVLDSEHWVDGEAAEYLEDGALPDFSAEHADVVLKNWDLFKGHLYLVGVNQTLAEIIQKLSHMKEVVLKAKADKVSKAEFLKAIDDMLNGYEKSKSTAGSHKKKQKVRVAPVF